MKEVEEMSIGGFAFMLETDASEKLGTYLKTLEGRYGREVEEDIEARVAELLLERCGRERVVSPEDIQAVIAVIGQPDSIDAEEPEPEPSPAAGNPRKKLFRDMENKRLGGVCSGLAAYFGIDVSWLRLAVTAVAIIIFFSGAEHGVWSLLVPVLYCVLWVAMPAARSAQDRWAMRGESGTLEEIRRNVSSGVREMGQAAGEVVRSSSFRQLGKIFLIVIGFVLLVTGTSGLASASLVGLKGSTLLGAPYLHFMDELSVEAPSLMELMSTPWVVVLVILAVLLPFVGMIYGGVQLLFGFKSPFWKPGLVIFVAWLIDVIVLLVLFAGEVLLPQLSFA